MLLGSALLLLAINCYIVDFELLYIHLFAFVFIALLRRFIRLILDELSSLTTIGNRLKICQLYGVIHLSHHHALIDNFLLDTLADALCSMEIVYAVPTLAVGILVTDQVVITWKAHPIVAPLLLHLME